MAGGSTEWRGRSVISKVVALLDAFTPAAPELSLGELAQLTGLPVSTTYRLVSELVDWGGLERVAGGGYRIGLRLWEVGSLAPRGETLREVALPFMSDLYEATRENVHLAVLDGTEVLYVEKLSGRRAMPVRTRRGGRLPLHATAAGKVLLAYAPESLFRETVAAGLKRYTAHTIIAPGHLRRALTEIRRTGIGYAREELTVGSHSVASAVLDADGSAVAALSVTLRSARDLRRLGPAVRTAAISVSRGLHERALLARERPDRVPPESAVGAGAGTPAASHHLSVRSSRG
jgi:DNA-binding IclR family transcriptional regulator